MTYHVNTCLFLLQGAAKVIHHTINVHTPQAIIPTAGSTVVTPSPGM